jgi:AcrR family transcriptional regulator
VHAERRGRGRPRGSTRERILDVALGLFNEQGYDKTSLRDISDRLGVTKAALYYHFQRKEDILLELHLRLHELARKAFRAFDDMDVKHAAAQQWIDFLDEFITEVEANRDIFLMHQRNHSALEILGPNERHIAEHENFEDFERQVRRVVEDSGMPLRLRVRLACALGAVVGALLEAGDAFAGAASDEVVGVVRQVIRDILGDAGAT